MGWVKCEKFEFVGYVWKGRRCGKVEGKESSSSSSGGVVMGT